MTHETSEFNLEESESDSCSSNELIEIIEGGLDSPINFMPVHKGILKRDRSRRMCSRPALDGFEDFKIYI